MSFPFLAARIIIAKRFPMGLMKRIAESRLSRGGLFKSGSWEGPFDISIEETGQTARFQRSRNTEEMEAFNEKIKSWGAMVTAALPGSVSSHGIKGSKLGRSIRNNYYYEYGEIYRIGFAFAREGVFVHKGVGRGYVMNNGIVVKLSKNPTGFRKAKPWFNPIIEQFIPKLEEIVMEYARNAIINSTRIYIR